MTTREEGEKGAGAGCAVLRICWRPGQRDSKVHGGVMEVNETLHRAFDVAPRRKPRSRSPGVKDDDTWCADREQRGKSDSGCVRERMTPEPVNVER